MRYGESTISWEMRLEFLLIYELEKSSDKVALSQMTRGQSTDVTLQIGDCRCQEGMAEVRGRKGP